MIIAFPELVRQSAPAINVHARVLLVSENLMQGIPPELPAAPRPDTAAIKFLNYLGVIYAAQNTLKNEPYMNGLLFFIAFNRSSIYLPSLYSRILRQWRILLL